MKLSICIPTHDGRGGCLRETLESVLGQITGLPEHKPEICVSDNGSKDATWEMLCRYRADYPDIFRIHRFERNQGGHVNFLKVVDMAEGEYCWLLGSDDHLMPNAIATVLDFLSKNDRVDGLSFLWRNYDRSMQEVLPTWAEEYGPEHKTDSLVYSDSTVAFCDLGLLLQFMSSHVFRRSKWQSVVESEGKEHVFSFRHYMHVYILARLITRSSCWGWIPSALVKRREFNDSLVDELGGGRHRYMIETTEDLAKCLKAASGANVQTYRVLMRKYFWLRYSPSNIADWKRLGSHSNEADRQMLQMMIRYHGDLPEFWLLAFPRLLVPHQFHKLRVQVGLGTKLRRLTSAWRQESKGG